MVGENFSARMLVIGMLVSDDVSVRPVPVRPVGVSLTCLYLGGPIG